jgi:release factor glutamine methyltransferase
MNLHALTISAIERLQQAGIDNPSLDARLLICEALSCDRAALLAQNERILTQAETDKSEFLIARRAAHEPVGRILGRREFWGLSFALNEATLEPRPDSESLIALALTLQLPEKPRLLDLGTGTGCLLLALLHEWPEATGLGIDLAPRAVEAAQKNAESLGLTARASFQTGDWLKDVTGSFDLILSNPPYIPTPEIAALMPEVRLFDPKAALDGGKDGLDPYRKLIPLFPRFLTPEGWALFEVGAGQAEDVVALFETHGFKNIQTQKDLGGISRCVAGQVAHGSRHRDAKNANGPVTDCL